MNKMIERFKNENIAVHCNTQEEYDELMRLLEKYDFRWTSSLKATFPNYFEQYKNKTYIEFDNLSFLKGLGYCNKKYYKEKNYEIIECKDFIKQVNAEEKTSSLEDCIIIIKEEFNSIFKHLCELDAEKEQIENELEKIEIKQEKTSNGNLHDYMYIDGKKYAISVPQREIVKKINSILDYIKDDEN